LGAEVYCLLGGGRVGVALAKGSGELVAILDELADEVEQAAGRAEERRWVRGAGRG
jgi:hypothetical protein